MNMKAKQEILDEFGKLIINNIFDESLTYYESLRTKTTKWNIGQEYSEIIDKLSEHDKDILFTYIKSILSASIFSFLQIFEENSNFKIIYEDNKKIVDLNKISEMLKAEHHGENGWIERFSKFKDKDNVD